MADAVVTTGKQPEAKTVQVEVKDWTGVWDGVNIHGMLFHKDCAPGPEALPEQRRVVVAPGDMCAKCLKFFGTQFQSEAEAQRKAIKEKAEAPKKPKPSMEPKAPVSQSTGQSSAYSTTTSQSTKK